MVAIWQASEDTYGALPMLSRVGLKPKYQLQPPESLILVCILNQKPERLATQSQNYEALGR